jgi:ankyrin repeat protein
VSELILFVISHRLSASFRSGGDLISAAADGDLSYVIQLLGHGADIQVKHTASGAVPLHMAARHGHVEVTVALIMRGARLDARTDKHRTALHEAAQKGHVTVCGILLDRGAEVDARDRHQSTPLHIASRHLAATEDHTKVGHFSRNLFPAFSASQSIVLTSFLYLSGLSDAAIARGRS